MSLIAEFTIDSEEFLLGRVVADCADLTVEIERVVPAGKHIMPYLWAYGSDLDVFEAELREDEHVSSVSVLDRLTEAALFKVLWETPAERFISAIVDSEATILEARSADDWTFKIRFQDHEGLSAFHEVCADHGISERLERVHPLSAEREQTAAQGLTRAQYETLREAVERGYYKVPRETSFAELAAELGVSEQAVSERIRRGTDAVFREYLPTVAFE